MPLIRVVHPELNLHYVRLEGVLDTEALAGFRESFDGDVGELAGMDELFDLAGVERIDLSSEEVRALARRSRERRRLTQPNRTVILAPTDPHFGLARMWETLSRASETQREAHVVRTLEQATGLLGLPGGWSPPAQSGDERV